MSELKYQSDEAYKRLVGLVMSFEGGYVWDKDDTGGATNHGISYNNNVAEVAKFGIHKPADMVKLTKDQAKEIYYDKYWLSVDCDKVAARSLRLAFIHFDTSVNNGVGIAARFLKKLSKPPEAFEGAGKNRELFSTLFLEYLAQRADYYTYCKTWPMHGKGWIRQRIAALIQTALKLEN